ncbi:MAG: GNAT family N-acetyltransferase [Ruthenibacterium sp.]
MNQAKIQFRAVRPSDYSALSKIICDTWSYERICTPKTAKAMSKLYLASCLTNQTFTCVAQSQGEPVGIIMGKNESTHRTAPRYAFGQLTAALAMLVTKEGRSVLKTFEGFDDINKALFSENTQTFDGEVAFFAVRSDQRGTGVGKELFRRLRAAMEAQGIFDFYLYTDSTCNYGFYEHQGMQRICEKKVRLKAYQDKEMSFFMYGLHSAPQGT